MPRNKTDWLGFGGGEKDRQRGAREILGFMVLFDLIVYGPTNGGSGIHFIDDSINYLFTGSTLSHIRRSKLYHNQMYISKRSSYSSLFLKSNPQNQSLHKPPPPPPNIPATTHIFEELVLSNKHTRPGRAGIVDCSVQNIDTRLKEKYFKKEWTQTIKQK